MITKKEGIERKLSFVHQGALYVWDEDSKFWITENRNAMWYAFRANGLPPANEIEWKED